MDRAPGQIITFYSYKGGTGRTLALANTACLLAQRQGDGKTVLMVDWDLEAPGLHRYFRDRFRRRFADAEDSQLALDEAPGLIELFVELQKALEDAEDGRLHSEEILAKSVLDGVDLKRFILASDIPSLHLLKAGRFDDTYSSQVNSFNWDNFFRRCPALLRLLAERLADTYSYVLIDSRTGITDTSGICTTLMPEKLVVVFTPNRQSLTGVLNLIRGAVRYRRESEDLRQLVVFPLPSRIEAARPSLRESWRFGRVGQDIAGFQPLFEHLFQEVYDLDTCRLGRYFDEVQVQHVPDYAYGEDIAVLIERSVDRFSLTRGFEVFSRWLVESPSPWEETEDPEQSSAEEANRVAEAVFARLTPEEQEAARRLLLELVRVSPSLSEGTDSRRKVLVRDLAPSFSSILHTLSDGNLVVESGFDEERSVELGSESLVSDWVRLKKWLDADREFLVWRQRMREHRRDWERTGRDRGALLQGALLAEAKKWSTQRQEDLAEIDRIYIAAGRDGKPLSWIGLVATVAVVAVGILLGWWQVEKTRSAELSRQLLDQVRAHAGEPLDLTLLLAVEATKANNSLEARTTLFDLLKKNSQISFLLPIRGGDIDHAVLAKQGNLGAGSHHDGVISLLDIERKKVTSISDDPNIQYLLFSPDGDALVVNYPDAVHIWSISSRKIIKKLSTSTSSSLEGSPRAPIVTFSPDGKLFAASRIKGVFIWSTNTWLETARFESNGLIAGAGFSSDSRSLLTVDFLAGVQSAWNADSAANVTALKPQKWGIHPCAERTVRRAVISSNGNVMAVLCTTEFVETYALNTRRLLTRVSSFDNFWLSGNGNVLLATIPDILLVDTATGTRLESPPLSAPYGTSRVAIDYSGNKVVNFGENLATVVDRRDLFAGTGRESLAALQARACRIANRNLSREEWALYFGDSAYRKTCEKLN